MEFANNNAKVNFIPSVVNKKKTAEKTDQEKGDEKEIRQER